MTVGRSTFSAQYSLFEGFLNRICSWKGKNESLINCLRNKVFGWHNANESVIFMLQLKAYQPCLKIQIRKWSVKDDQTHWTEQSHNASTFAHTHSLGTFEGKESLHHPGILFQSKSTWEACQGAVLITKHGSLCKVTARGDISTRGLKRKAPSNLAGTPRKLYSAQHSCFQLKLSCCKREVWHLSFLWGSYGIQ